MNIGVTSVNDGPVAEAEAISGSEDSDFVYDGQLDASDIDGTVVSYEVADAPEGLTVNNDGTYTYAPAAGTFDYLAEGETAEITVDYTVTDDKGATAANTITITVTGTNDAPTVSSADTAGTAVEDGVLTDSGVIEISDLDDGASFTAEVTGDNNLGSLTASVVDGTVSWDYSVDNADVQYLADGETRTETFTVTISDENGESVTQDVTVTITGTNDAPVVSDVSLG